MRQLGAWRAGGAFLVALGLQAFGTVLIEGYSQPFAVRSLLVLASLLAIGSIGQTLVVILGGIDLSVPFLIGFANVVAAALYGEGMAFALVCVIVAALAALIGAANGFLSASLRVHPLILTLGVGTAVQGAVLLWTAGFPAGSAPPGVTEFVSIGARAWGLPVPWLVPATVVLFLVLIVIMARTPFGRRLYALGANPTAAPYALIGPIRMWTLAYALSAVFAAAAGVLLLGFTGSAYAEVGQPYLFQSIAAVVVGGTALTGGAGGFLGTAAGALVLTEINTLLIGLGLSPAMVEAALGAVIIALVSLYGREEHVRAMI
ncbi:MAG: ABC transporter permease [Acetobacteraceae bacterium]